MKMPRWLVRYLLAPLTRLYDWLFHRSKPATWLAPYVDPYGQGWRKPPEWLDPQYPDEGQHDWAKRELRIAIYRVVHGLSPEPGVLDIRKLHAGPRTETVPRLWPLGQQLAAACRNLGFLRLAHAAARDLCDDEALLAFWEMANAEVAIEVTRRKEHNDETAAIWDPVKMGGPFTPDPPEHTLATLSLGPFDPVPDLAAPLRPFDLVTATMSSPSTEQYTRQR